MVKKFVVHDSTITGLLVLEKFPIFDQRGSLTRIFDDELFNDLEINFLIKQVNLTLNIKKGTVRGMHFQKDPKKEVKMVSCLEGKIFDVAIDIRKDSPTFLSWHSEILSESNNKTLFIPEGFAHGYQALTKNCRLLYAHSENYSAEYEDAINPLDPSIAIQWPMGITGMSERDKSHPFLSKTFEGI